MNLGKITVITPPSKIFNLNLGYLLVCPSMHVKHQFQTILSSSLDDLNVFIYENGDNDIDWLLSVACMTDVVILDVDNCDEITSKFVAFLLAQANVHFITSDELTPYNLISQNRIFNLDWIAEQLQNQTDEDDDESED